MSIIPEIVLYMLVKNEMQTLGEDIVTSVGPGSSTLPPPFPPLVQHQTLLS